MQLRLDGRDVGKVDAMSIDAKWIGGKLQLRGTVSLDRPIPDDVPFPARALCVGDYQFVSVDGSECFKPRPDRMAMSIEFDED